MNNEVKVCSRCIMDSTDPEIQFDEKGICNHCKLFEEKIRKYAYQGKIGQEKLAKLVSEIKANGKNKEYDCIIGVSGGVDSTYIAYLVKKLGLKPLAVHLDNGWDSELAVNNIEKTLKRLSVDLYTYVIDWEEFKNLQVSFLKASVVNCEIPTDHAICATLYRLAVENGIKYIIGGSNIVTEGIMPKSWVYTYRDLRQIRAIHKKYGTVKLKSYPQISYFKELYYNYIKKIKYVHILNYIPYNKKEAMATIENELGWKNYGGKHYESIYTRFYQSYILPRKFNIDKRKAHLSALICSGQITRDQALMILEKEDICPENQLAEDKEYVIKKLGFSNEEFEKIMALPIKDHLEYPSYQFLYQIQKFLAKPVKFILNIKNT